ncbi:MAG TPA: RsmD family RNA methyltransferase [Candidatus Saccharimonadales bacterium]|nr:RsmD family RNA methyltransferase [Candidatus Saccharimonadales bacterium]
MRVIAGALGGQVFDSPGTHRTHPMSDKARGALFNILGDIEGLSVLDAFAGSGALSLEAVSRGAASALAIDNDKNAQKTIARNIETLRVGRQVKLIKAPANTWLQTNPDKKFDIVLCDPPYKDLQPNLLKRLAGSVALHGIYVLSWPSSREVLILPSLVFLERHLYGDMQLIFYRNEPQITGLI